VPGVRIGTSQPDRHLKNLLKFPTNTENKQLIQVNLSMSEREIVQDKTIKKNVPLAGMLTNTGEEQCNFDHS